jgi:hypothetical protein
LYGYDQQSATPTGNEEAPKWGGKECTKSKKKKTGDAPSFLVIPFASILNLGPIPPLALRRRPQRVLHLPLHRRGMQRPEVFRGLAKDVLQREHLEDLVRREDEL